MTLSVIIKVCIASICLFQIGATYCIETKDATDAFSIEKMTSFPSPWSMVELSRNEWIVTDNKIVAAFMFRKNEKKTIKIQGLPKNMRGIYDVVLDNKFKNNGMIYFSFAEFADGNPLNLGRQKCDGLLKPSGLSIFSGVLTYDKLHSPFVSKIHIIWRQSPKICTHGEYGGRLALSPDGNFLFATAGDLQEFEPVQSIKNTLGKIIRIHPDGSIPQDNPFVSVENSKPEIWTLGHRNHYGLAFNSDGNLWSHENGPEGGDELNLIMPGKNYGWPIVSWGNHYDGAAIKRPTKNDGFEPPVIDWTPAIAPSGLIFYTGSLFKGWKDSALITGLKSSMMMRVAINGKVAKELERFNFGERLRDVRQSIDGSIWILQDAPGGKLFRVTPK